MALFARPAGVRQGLRSAGIFIAADEVRYSRDDPGIISRFLPLTEDCQVWIYTAQCAL